MMRHLASSNSESELSVYEPDQVQPNAIDLKVDKIFTIESTKFTISEEQKNFIEKFSFFEDWMEKTEEQQERNREKREMLFSCLIIKTIK